MEKLKRGETIGPVTKDIQDVDDTKEGEDTVEKPKENTIEKPKEEAKDDAAKAVEEKPQHETKEESKVTTVGDEQTEVKEPKKEEKAEIDEDMNATDGDNDKREHSLGHSDDKSVNLVSTVEVSTSTVTKVDSNEGRKETSISKISDTEDSSDTGSTDLDLPATPDSADLTTPNTQPSNFVDANVYETEEMRTAALDRDISPQMLPDVAAALTMTPVTPDQSEKIEADAPPKFTQEPFNQVEVEEKEEVIFPARSKDTNIMEGWEMLQMVLGWVRNEFSPDEGALARQLANNEISYRFLWLYLVPGTLISLQDPISKQQMAARVCQLCLQH